MPSAALADRGDAAVGPMSDVSSSCVAERIVAFAEAGVTVLNVTPLGPHPLRTLETLAGLLT